MTDQTLLLLSLIVVVPVLALFGLLLRLSRHSQLKINLRNPFVDVSIVLKPHENGTDTEGDKT